MKKRDYRDYLHDILDSINEVIIFVEGMSFEDFTGDRKTINAVIRSLEVIGEATKRIPVFLRNKHSALPWKKMAGMRDKLIHEYFGVDLEILWEVATKEIPPLKSLLENILKDKQEG